MVEETARPVEAQPGYIPLYEEPSAYGTPSRAADRAAAIGPWILVGIVALLSAAAFSYFMVLKPKMGVAKAAEFQDLGSGISNATGLKGNLKTRWQDNKTQYELKLEPIDPLQTAGFLYVLDNPPSPLSIHMRLLDGSGFALCGKDVLFPDDSASPGETDRDPGQDTFQSAAGEDGKINALNAQGIVPCTPDQYKQVVYWDFTTNFPTLAEQDNLAKHRHLANVKDDGSQRRAHPRAPRTGFIAEGDDWVTGYERGLLLTSLRRSYQITRPADRTTADTWAEHNARFHYRCDQQARCLLVHAGGTDAIAVLAVE
jgi:hypothetical protein